LNKKQGDVELRTLAELIAELEAGESPPPADVRKSVYSSLHQTHLPKLDEYDIIDYDNRRKLITLQSNARRVHLYMEVLTPYGIPWSTFYRWLNILGMLLILADQIGVFGRIEDYPVFISVSFLVVVVLSRAYQLWSNNWMQLRSFLRE